MLDQVMCKDTVRVQWHRENVILLGRWKSVIHFTQIRSDISNYYNNMIDTFNLLNMIKG